MKCMHAPSDGMPTPEALSSVQTPSDWYTQELIQGIQFMINHPFPIDLETVCPWRSFLCA